MTFTFLDKIAGIVGEPAALAAETRARVFREPVRHEGLRRLPPAAVLAHVGRVAVGVANDRLRPPLVAALIAHAQEAGDLHEMTTGEGAGTDGYRAAVVEAFAGNDCGIDVTVFGDGDAKPDAVADQVLVVPEDDELLGRVLARMGLGASALRPIADEVLAPEFASTEWSLITLALAINGNAAFADAVETIPEVTGYILSGDAALRATGFQLVGITPTEELTAWLDERAMFSSSEQDDADVAEVLRLVNQEGGGLPDDSIAASVTAAGVEPEKPAPAAQPPKPAASVAAPESDLTRAVSAALRALFELTKETDTHVAEVLGVPKAVVAQARKGVTPWEPDSFQFERLLALVVKYVDGLLAVRDGLLDQRRDD